jgi:hypothetical protein
MMLRGWPPAAHWRETASSPHCAAPWQFLLERGSSVLFWYDEGIGHDCFAAVRVAAPFRLPTGCSPLN